MNSFRWRPSNETTCGRYDLFEHGFLYAAGLFSWHRRSCLTFLGSGLLRNRFIFND
jgi:hypothetical protein